MKQIQLPFVTGEELASILRSDGFSRLLRETSSYTQDTGYEAAFEVSRDFHGKHHFSTLACGSTREVKIRKALGIACDFLYEGEIQDALTLFRVHSHPTTDEYPVPSCSDFVGLDHLPLHKYCLIDVRPVCCIASIPSDRKVGMLLYQKKYPEVPLTLLPDMYLGISDQLEADPAHAAEAIRSTALIEALNVRFVRTKRGYSLEPAKPDMKVFEYQPILQSRS